LYAVDQDALMSAYTSLVMCTWQSSAFASRSFTDAADLREPRVWDAADAPPLLRPSGSGHRRVLDACEAALRTFPNETSILDLIRFWTDLCEVLCPAPGTAPPLRVGVPRLLELTHVSPGYLSRAMRRHYGATPTEFVMGLRLAQATALLATTDDPVADIAHRCGFNSQSYFTRRFVRGYGVSPSRFRHQVQRKYVP
jgi:AraC-like DNA-binding protein